MNKPDYERTLAMLSEARKDEILMKKTLRAELWAEYQARLLLARHRISRLANEAVEQGASLAKVGRAYGTSNFTTIKGLIALAQEQVEAEAALEAKVEPKRAWDWEERTATLVLHRWSNATGQHIGDLVIPSERRPWLNGNMMWRPTEYPDVNREELDRIYQEVNDITVEPEPEPEVEDEFLKAMWGAEGADDDDYRESEA